MEGGRGREGEGGREREGGRGREREGLSLSLQMSVDNRVKLTCSPHYTYIWGGESFQQMVDRQTIDCTIHRRLDFAEPMCTRMRKKCRVELAAGMHAWVPKVTLKMAEQLLRTVFFETILS